MSGDRSRRFLVLVAVWLLAAAVVAPAFVGGRPANEIPVYEATGSETLDSTTAEAWNQAPAASVAMASAPSTVPDADDTSTGQVSVQAATKDDRLYVRLSWPDGTADRSDGSPREFADAVAVQMPVNTSSRPAIAMGSPQSMVNVWYWSASSGTQELLAGGAGSTTKLSNPAVATNATHQDGRWAVVFSRPMEPASDDRTAITRERDLDVAFAVWNGSNMERSGRKAVSEWQYFALGPGPQGPPYAAVLWTIAGLAMVVVVLVTGHAVFNRGGDGGG